jgi:glyoxylase-like metal-dependent hydrolase (beta-lactamase superfamily II)
MTRPAGRRRWLVGALALVAAGSALAGGYAALRTRAVPLLGPSAVTLVPGVHLLGALEPAAAYAVETSAGLVLVDSGLKANARSLKEQLTALGLDWKRVRAILLTHVHGDHCGGAEHLRAAAGAKVYAGRGDASALRAGAPREAFFSVFSMPDDQPHPTTVDVELAGDEALDFGDVRFRALATPGHTPGSVCYLLERGDLRVLFTGDVITALLGNEEPQVSGRNPLGTYPAYLAPRYRGDAKDYLASLRKLRALPVPDLVLPGHPRSDPTPQSPRLTRRRWEEMLDRGIREMETLLARYAADGADFLDGTPKRLLPDLYYLGDFRGVAMYVISAKPRLFVVNAPGGPGLGDFLRSGLRQLGVEAAEPAAVLLTSCDPDQTAGLWDLVETYHLRVVAPAAGLSTIKDSCPPGTAFLPAEDLPKQGWFPVTPLPLRGAGVAPAAYLLPWAGKTVLFSGKVPVWYDREATTRLLSELSPSRTTTMDYLLSVEALDGLAPDLWLPAVPTYGQNANLYAKEWRDVIAKNYGAGVMILRRRFGLGLN